MPFPKIIEGTNVTLRHVRVGDAEAILAAWKGDLANELRASLPMTDRLRIRVAEYLITMATRIHPSATAKIHGPRVASTWRHHRPRTLRDEREKLRKFVQDDDRYQYLMIRKNTNDIVGCIGFETNCKKPQDRANVHDIHNLRIARLGMLLFREDPWDHHCEKEAIRLLLRTIFRQEFVSKDGQPFRIVDVIVPVNMEDELTLGVLTGLGFRISRKEPYDYHGRETRILEYFPTDLDPESC